MTLTLLLIVFRCDVMVVMFFSKNPYLLEIYTEIVTYKMRYVLLLQNNRGGAGCGWGWRRNKFSHELTMTAGG